MTITQQLELSQVSVSGGANYYSDNGLLTYSYDHHVENPFMAPMNLDLSDAISFYYVPPAGYEGYPHDITVTQSRATQVSDVAGNVLSAQGTATSHTSVEFSHQEPLSAHSSANAVFHLVFALNAETDYHMSGGLVIGNGLASIVLSMLEGDTLVNLDNSWLYEGSTFPRGQYDKSFDLTGVLQPGVYDLTASALASMGSAGDALATYNLSMELNSPLAETTEAVPDAGGTGVLFMLAVVMLVLIKTR